MTLGGVMTMASSDARARPAERHWLEFVADIMDTPLTRLPAERIADQLLNTFEGTGCVLLSCEAPIGDGVPLQIWPAERFAARRHEIVDWVGREACSVHPLVRYYRATRTRRCMQVADVPSRVADERVLAAWHEVAEAWGGVVQQVAIPLLAGPPTTFVIGRREPFAAAEMRLAHRLQRLLSGLDRQASAIRRRARPAARPTVAGGRPVALTPRELAVLALLADGLTAASIGRRLAIAERTVQKHLEHSYAKLGVTDRLGAVLQAQRLGVLRSR